MILFILVFCLSNAYAKYNYSKKDMLKVIDSLNNSIPLKSYDFFSRIFIEEKNKKIRYLYTFIIKLGKNKKDELNIPIINNSDLNVYLFNKKSKKPKHLKIIKNSKTFSKINSIISLKEAVPGDVILIRRSDYIDKRAQFEYMLKPNSIKSVGSVILQIKSKRKLYYSNFGIDDVEYTKRGDKYIWKYNTEDYLPYLTKYIFISSLPTRKSRISWYKKIYKFSKYKKLRLLQIARKLISGINGISNKTSRIYEYLLNISESLYKSFIPRINSKKSVINIRNTADFCRVFLHMLRQVKLKAFLIIPFENKGKIASSMPANIPGIMVLNKKKKIWFFPGSRFFHPNYIPPEIQGKRAVKIGKNSNNGFILIPKKKYKYGDIKLWMNVHLRNTGSAYFTAYILLSGMQQILFRNLINLNLLKNIGRTVFDKILGGSFVYHIYKSEIKHKRILQFPLSIKLSGSIKNFAKINNSSFFIKPSLLMNANQLKFIKSENLFRERPFPSRYYEKISFYLPHGTKLKNELRNLKIFKNNIKLKSKIRYISGKRIKKPKHWRKKLWKKWLLYNPSKYKDRIVFYNDVFFNWNYSKREHILNSLYKFNKQKIELYLGQY